MKCDICFNIDQKTNYVNYLVQGVQEAVDENFDGWIETIHANTKSLAELAKGSKVPGVPNMELKAYSDKYQEDLIDLLDDEYDLIYVDYDDELSEQQVSHLLNGAMEEFWDPTQEWWEADSRWVGSEYVWDSLVFPEPEVCDECGSKVIDPSDYETDVRDEISERDSGSWYDRLVRNTPKMLFTATLVPEGLSGEDCCIYYESDTEENRDRLRNLLDQAGITEYTSDWFDNVFGETMYNYAYPMLVFWADPADLILSEVDEFEIECGELWLGNTWSGSGYFSSYDAPVRVKRSQIEVDSLVSGYGAMETAGLCTWNCEVTPLDK